ncbi:LacI family DNA-binding transcriptional regulator [Alteriqipengyuania lutimaris]|uniref:LacI family DNA-binding transcriptional regulator n=1 Tax=Alteriqipengyuania lutimaris TaxID=1538146 RepID=A0A395LJJ7_9SPHN|nr:LacI family DNA-binding transcriptional regulator [Alteriqipengyuania lutimaris]MBB3033844.1 LacI family transcriptional regulator [Alteriqipengyuania lutimaris]RDS77186.1 LacI family DNA-binding transcriptional regulator [Alteriqipengyuania lutimaris]
MARRRQAVTIKHVAADAGVSLQTVSRVINREPSVRPEMQERVQASIDKLGYVPSIAAQRMSGSRSYLILALNDRERTIGDWTARQGSDWVDQMLLGGMLKCAEHGYRMIIELVDTHNDHVEREINAALVALQPDGIILTPPHSDDPLITGLLDERGIPFARIGSMGNGCGIPLIMGDEGAARLATDHLLGLGHTRIGFITGAQGYELSKWRAAGWRAAMADAGLAIEGLCEEGDFTFASGLSAARKLLAREPRATAIVASNDQMALAAIDAATEVGLTVPQDLSVVSFDNTPIAMFNEPALTAIDQPIAATVARAVELIIAANRGGELPTAPEVVEADIILRKSTAPVTRE